MATRRSSRRRPWPWASGAGTHARAFSWIWIWLWWLWPLPPYSIWCLAWLAPEIRRRPGTGFRAAHRAAARLDPAGFNPSRCCAPQPPAMAARHPGQDATRRTEIRRLRTRPTRDTRQHPLQSWRPGCARANGYCHAQRARDEAAPCARWARRPAPVRHGAPARARAAPAIGCTQRAARRHLPSRFAVSRKTAT